MKRYGKRRDRNEKEFVAELEADFYVKRFDTPLDLHACNRRTGLAFWVEVKELEAKTAHRRSRDERGALWNTYPQNAERLHWLTPGQRDFVAEYPGAWVVALSATEVLAFHEFLDSLPVL